MQCVLRTLHRIRSAGPVNIFSARGREFLSSPAGLCLKTHVPGFERPFAVLAASGCIDKSP
jgi:hypothetical protein